MKLLFCYNVAKADTDHAGNAYVSGITKEVVDRYRSLSDKITFVFSDSGIVISDEEAKRRQAAFEGVNVILVPSLTGSIRDWLSISRRNSIKKMIKAAVDKADGVVIRTGGVCVAICRKLHKPYLIEMVGCTWDALWNHGLYGKVLAPGTFFSTRRRIYNAPYVLYVTKQFLQRRYPTKGISSGISDVSMKEQDICVLEERLHKIKEKRDSETVVIGSAGGLDVAYKGQQYVIQALAILKKQGFSHYEYQIAGVGCGARLMTEAEKYHVRDQIKIVGSLPHDKIFNWYQSLDLYAQPSLQEGLPRAVVEAMSCAVPCIGTDAGGIPELIGSNMLFRKKNAKQIAELIQSLNKDLWAASAKENYARAKEYSFEVLNQRRNEFYHSFFEKSGIG